MAGMADALRSCNIDIGVHKNDISKAIIHLCDRLTSIEQAHKNHASNAGRNCRSLEKQNQSMQQKIDKMTQTEQNLVEKLNQYRHEKAELQKLLEVSKDKPSNNESRRMRSEKKRNDLSNTNAICDSRNDGKTSSENKSDGASRSMQSLKKRKILSDSTNGFIYEERKEIPTTKRRKASPRLAGMR